MKPLKSEKAVHGKLSKLTPQVSKTKFSQPRFLTTPNEQDMRRPSEKSGACSLAL